MSKKHVIYSEAYDKQGRLICVAFNSYEKSHTIQYKYSKRVGKPGQIFIHSEIHAIIKAKNMNKKIHSIKVSRWTAKGEPAMAKPCAACWLALKEHGVKRIEFTTGGSK